MGKEIIVLIDKSIVIDDESFEFGHNEKYFMLSQVIVYLE